MKYIIELEKIEGTNLYRAKGANTLVFDEWGLKNILKPLPEPEVDWTKVKVDTPILVSNNGEMWDKKHFAKYMDGRVYGWNRGRTSYTAYNDNDCCSWNVAKLAEVGE